MLDSIPRALLCTCVLILALQSSASYIEPNSVVGYTPLKVTIRLGFFHGTADQTARIDRLEREMLSLVNARLKAAAIETSDTSENVLDIAAFVRRDRELAPGMVMVRYLSSLESPAVVIATGERLEHAKIWGFDLTSIEREDDLYKRLRTYVEDRIDWVISSTEVDRESSSSPARDGER